MRTDLSLPIGGRGEERVEALLLDQVARQARETGARGVEAHLEGQEEESVGTVGMQAACLDHSLALDVKS